MGDIDLLLKPNTLELFLARPDKTIVSKISEAYAKVQTVKLGNVNELTFTIPYNIDIGHKLAVNPTVLILRDRYLIKAKLGDNEEWYIISNIQDTLDDNGEMKLVTAYLLPYEMTGKNIKIFKEISINLTTALAGGTTTDVETGELRPVVGILSNTKWKLGFVDATFDIKYRGFDLSSITALDAVFQIAETFKALIVWDTFNRKINFYNPDNYGVDRGLTLNYGHYLQSMNRESKSDEVVTRLKVFGKDGMSIQRVNLTGQNYIEDYSYFMYPFQRDANKKVISHSHYMSDALCNAILDYSAYLEGRKGTFNEYLTKLTGQQLDYTTKSDQLSTLIEQMDAINIRLDLANSKGDAAASSQAQSDKAAKQTEINSKQSEVNGIANAMGVTNTQIQNLRSTLAYSEFFTQDLLNELNDFIVEKEWADEKYIDDNDLYADAKKDFENLKIPQVTITIDAVNFMSIVESQRDWGKLNLGDTITIRHERMGVNVTAKIIEYSIDHEESKITLTIANTKDILSDDEKFIKLLYNSSSASTTLNNNKSLWDGIDATKSAVEEYINNALDATKQGIIAGVHNSVDINERGILVRDSSDPSTYLVIQNGVLAITRNNGNTWSHAITKDGIIGDRIVGKILAGVNLTIDASDKNGVRLFKVDANGVTISGGSLTITGGLPPSQLDPSFKDSLVNLGTPYNGVVIDSANGLVITKTDVTIRTLLNATAGFKFQKNTGSVSSPTWTDMLAYDPTSGNLTIDGIVNARDLKVQGKSVLTGDGKFKALSIETLEVGKNVLMGKDAYISWDNVTNPPPIPVVPSYITSTKITATSIESPNIYGGTIAIGSGNNIFKADSNGIYLGNASFGSAPFSVSMDGTLNAAKANIKGAITSGSTITGATIEGGNINIKTDLYVGNKIVMNEASFGAELRFSGSNYIIYDPMASSLTITTGSGGLWANGVRLDRMTAVFA